MPTTVRSDPPMSSGRRPNRSADQPTTGRSKSDAMLNEPIDSPNPRASASRASFANRGAIGRTSPPATKNASVAAARTDERRGCKTRLGRLARLEAVNPRSGRPSPSSKAIGRGVRIELVCGDGFQRRPGRRVVRRRHGAATADGRSTIAQTCASALASRAGAETSARPAARWRSSAVSSSGTPAPVAAVVIRTSGRFGRGRDGSVSRPADARASPGAARPFVARPACRPC